MYYQFKDYHKLLFDRTDWLDCNYRNFTVKFSPQDF